MLIKFYQFLNPSFCSATCFLFSSFPFLYHPSFLSLFLHIFSPSPLLFFILLLHLSAVSTQLPCHFHPAYAYHRQYFPDLLVAITNEENHSEPVNPCLTTVYLLPAYELKVECSVLFAFPYFESLAGEERPLVLSTMFVDGKG